MDKIVNITTDRKKAASTFKTRTAIASAMRSPDAGRSFEAIASRAITRFIEAGGWRSKRDWTGIYDRARLNDARTSLGAHGGRSRRQDRREAIWRRERDAALRAAPGIPDILAMVAADPNVSPAFKAAMGAGRG